MRVDAFDLLAKLAFRVEELFLQSQDTRPKDQAKIFALYREAYLSYHKQKAFMDEQELRLQAKV